MFLNKVSQFLITITGILPVFVVTSFFVFLEDIACGVIYLGATAVLCGICALAYKFGFNRLPVKTITDYHAASYNATARFAMIMITIILSFVMLTGSIIDIIICMVLVYTLMFLFFNYNICLYMCGYHTIVVVTEGRVIVVYTKQKELKGEIEIKRLFLHFYICK